MILIASAIIRDDNHTTRFQSVVKGPEQTQLVLDMQNGVATINHIVELIRIVHKRGVFDVEIDSVLDQSSLIVAEILSDVDHVDR